MDAETLKIILNLKEKADAYDRFAFDMIAFLKSESKTPPVMPDSDSSLISLLYEQIIELKTKAK